MASVNRCENCGNWYPKNGFHVCASLKQEVEKKMTKSSTPLVDSLGVFVEHAGMPGAYVSAADLEAALEKLTVVYGDLDAPKDQIGWSDTKLASDTHTARLLGIQEITKEPVKVEHIVSFPEGHRCYAINGEEFGSKLAGKLFKVTYEEIER